MRTCWYCGAEIEAERIEIETVLRARHEAHGGPYRTIRCHACGVENGALRNGAGDWLLYPLEGLDDPTLVDWISPRLSRKHLRAAHDWWLRHRGAVEKFRRRRQPTPEPAATDPGGVNTGPRSHPAAGAERETRSAPDDDAGGSGDGRQTEPESPPKSGGGPMDRRRAAELLGVDGEADTSAIRRAYRRALKLCHPDRVANLDPEIQELAHRKAKALRRAYETLLDA